MKLLLEWFLEDWRKKSTFEKILDTFGYALAIFYFIFLPALAFLAAIEIALNPW